jgi:hypothetical protein
MADKNKKEKYRKIIVGVLVGLLAVFLIVLVITDGKQARRCSGYKCVLEKTAKNR